MYMLRLLGLLPNPVTLVRLAAEAGPAVTRAVIATSGITRTARTADSSRFTPIGPFSDGCPDVSAETFRSMSGTFPDNQPGPGRRDAAAVQQHRCPRGC